MGYTLSLASGLYIFLFYFKNSLCWYWEQDAVKKLKQKWQYHNRKVSNVALTDIFKTNRIQCLPLQNIYSKAIAESTGLCRRLPGRRSLSSAWTNRLLVLSVKLSTVGRWVFPVTGPTILNILPDDLISALSRLCRPFVSVWKYFCSRPRSLTLSSIPVKLCPYRYL